MLRGGQIVFPPIPEPVDELITTTRRGNRASVGKLVHILMQDIGKYTAEIFDALVSQLRPDILTKVIRIISEGAQVPAPLLYAKETGSMAISGVYMASLGCNKHPQEKEATVAIIRGSLPTILTWILVDLGQRPGFVDCSKPVKAEEPSFVLHAGLLRGMMDMDPALESDVLASPVAVDIALVLWSTLTDGSKPLFLAHQKYRVHEAGCAIIDVVLRFVRPTRSDNPAPIIRRLSGHSTPCDELSFVAQLVGRAAILVTYSQARQGTMNYLKVLESCRALVEINHCLMLQHPRTLGAGIRATGHVLTYCNLLSLLSRARVDEEIQSRYMERIGELFVFVFSQWVLGSTTSFQRNLVDALDGGGILSAISIFLKKRSLSKEAMDKIFFLINMVKTTLLFPVAVGVLRRQVSRNPEWTSQGRVPKDAKVPLVEICSQLLAVGFDMRSAYESIPRKFPICDNLVHHSNNPPPFINAKACSHCQSVVYCSKKCQTQDWKARHRFECDPSRRVYLEQKQEDRRYRQRLRAHHLGLTIRYFHHSLASKYGPVIASKASSTIPMVAVVDLKTLPYTPGYLALQKYTEQQRPLIPMHLRRRFDDMVAVVTSPEAADEPTAYRMLHAEVRFGKERVSIIGTVTGKDTHSWSGGPRVMSSMLCSRVATDAEEPPMAVPQFAPLVLPEHLLKESGQ